MEPDQSICEACGELVERGALRCRHCGVAFAGSEASRRIRPTVRESSLRVDEDGELEGAGVGLEFGFEPDEP